MCKWKLCDNHIEMLKKKKKQKQETKHNEHTNNITAADCTSVYNFMICNRYWLP